jgi:hypothetical protein
VDHRDHTSTAGPVRAHGSGGNCFPAVRSAVTPRYEDAEDSSRKKKLEAGQEGARDASHGRERASSTWVEHRYDMLEIGADAANPPSVAGSRKPRRITSMPSAATPVPISNGRLAMSSWKAI